MCILIPGQADKLSVIGVIAVIPETTPATVIVESPINKDVPGHACGTGCMYIAYIESTAHLCMDLPCQCHPHAVLAAPGCEEAGSPTAK